MSGLADLKTAARKAAFVRRKEAHAKHRARAASALTERLSGVEGRIVAGYLPIRTEADPLPAMEHLSRANRVCVPVVEGPGRPLSFRTWTPGCALVEGPFRVMVPAAGDVLVPDILIVPMVAFDPALYRLGYGGGFYDRTLEALRSKQPILALGFAYSGQEAEVLPLEPTDQPLDEIVTEAGVRHAKS